MTSIKHKQVRALVAFCDTSGFNSYTDRVSTSQKSFQTFCKSLTREFLEFQKKTGYFVKIIGDGCMVVKELSGNRAPVIEFLRDLEDLRLSVERIIAAMKHSAPDLFLVRCVSGPILRLSWGKGTLDYFGRAVNKAERLKSIGRNISTLVHDSVHRLVTTKRAEKEGIEVTDMKPPDGITRGLNESDVIGLKAYRIP